MSLLLTRSGEATRSADARSGKPGAGRVQRLVAVGLIIFIVFMISPNTDGGDGYLVIPTAHSLLHQRNLDLSEFSEARWFHTHYAVSRVNGSTVNYFPWLTSVFAIPVVLTTDALHHVGVGMDQGIAIDRGLFTLAERVTAAGEATLAALALGWLTLKLLRRVEMTQPADASGVTAWIRADSDAAFAVFAFTMAFATSIWSTASRSTWQHAPSILLGALGMVGLLSLTERATPTTDRVAPRAIRNPLIGVATGAAFGFAYWIRPTNAVLTLVAVVVLWLLNRRVLWSVVVGMTVAHSAMLILNMVLLGTVLPPYFRASRFEFHPQFAQAVAGNLVSPARGLFVFSPFLLAAGLMVLPARWKRLDRSARVLTVCALLGSAAYLVIVSGFAEKWWAGISFGPRFMSESLVLLGPLALVAIFGPRLTSSGTFAKPRLAFRFTAVAAVVCAMVIHGTGSTLTGVMCWGDRARSDYPARVWDWSDAQFLEGTDLLIHGGAMNPECPRL